MAVEHAEEREVEEAAERLARLRQELHGLLFGQEALIEKVMIGLLARGHLLLEGLPGLGKTQLVKGLSQALALDSKRIQFTPDLLPGDITGNPILQEQDGTRRFVFSQGPIFANLVLADEINRASPKTQSALLEAMQERAVTVLGETHRLREPFFVIATQNPIELEGTYPLPEAQLDRFLFKLEVPRAGVETLEAIVSNRELGEEPKLDPVLSAEELLRLSSLARKIFLPRVVANFIARLVDATDPSAGPLSDSLRFGASPRAALSLSAAARARALLEGRVHAAYEDVVAVAPDTLNHRLILEYSARFTGRTARQVVADLLEAVDPRNEPVPDTLKAAKV